MLFPGILSKILDQGIAVGRRTYNGKAFRILLAALTQHSGPRKSDGSVDGHGVDVFTPWYRLGVAQHSRLAKEAGASDAAIDAVAHRKPLDELSDEEAFPIRYARELLLKKRVSDDTFAKARERFGDQGVVCLTATVGYYSMMAGVNALEIVPGLECRSSRDVACPAARNVSPPRSSM